MLTSHHGVLGRRDLDTCRDLDAVDDHAVRTSQSCSAAHGWWEHTQDLVDEAPEVWKCAQSVGVVDVDACDLFSDLANVLWVVGKRPDGAD